jgi:hypothetical protein
MLVMNIKYNIRTVPPKKRNNASFVAHEPQE